MGKFRDRSRNFRLNGEGEVKFAYQVNSWGGVAGTPGAVTDIGSGFYLTPGDPSAAIVAIAEAGFSGIEIFDGNLLALAESKDDFVRQLDAKLLALVGVYSGGHFIYPDVREDELARFDRSIAIAAEFGAIHFVIGGGAVRSTGRRDHDFVVMADLLDEVAERARNAGLLPSYHPHLGSLAETPDQIDALLGASSIGLCADVAHLAAGGGDPVAIIDKYAERLQYVHLKDYDSDTGGFVPLGEGTLDMAGIVNAVVRSGYSGWVGVELDGYSGDPAHAARRSFTYLEGSPLASLPQ
jgi:inosose dehydratase